MRTFIAIELPGEVQSALAALQHHLRAVKAEVSWTKPENIHLTLKFLGEIEEKSLDEITRALIDTTAGFSAFTLTLNGIGVFPNIRQPRILWAGLSGEIDKLVVVQQGLEERLGPIGLSGDEKVFHPHLTVGRVKSNRNARELIARADLYDLPQLSFEIRQIVVMRSELRPSGAQYTPLVRASLVKSSG